MRLYTSYLISILNLIMIQDSTFANPNRNYRTFAEKKINTEVLLKKKYLL